MSARLHGTPTTIARLNVPYGDNGGWPDVMLSAGRRGIAIEVPDDGEPARYNPIHEDDIAAMVPRPRLCVGAGDDGQLGRRGHRQHPGVDGVPHRAVGCRHPARSQPIGGPVGGDRTGPPARAGREGRGPLEGRPSAHGGARHPNLLGTAAEPG
jgi:hypothetical protein